MAEKKYYVVWKGNTPGIYDSWAECSNQIKGFPNALYKSFKTKEDAENAYGENAWKHIGKENPAKEQNNIKNKKIGSPIQESISVDGACSSSTGLMEYQGVYTKTKQTLFKMGPFEDGTNNIAEFLALVHALAYCKQNNINLPIYSDSNNALTWLRNKQAKTKLEKTDRNIKIFELLQRAEKWIKENTYKNQVLKWETQAWGENPADFGRK